MKPTVLYTTSSASPQSGAFRILLDLYRGCRQQGYEAILVLPEQDKEYGSLMDPSEARSLRFLHLPQPSRQDHLLSDVHFAVDTFRSVAQLVRIIRQEGVEIVHVNEILDVYGAIAAKVAGVKCVWSVRAELSPWPLLKKSLPFLALSLADSIVAASESVREELFPKESTDPSKVQVLYDPGFDLTRFDARLNGRKLRRKFGLTEQQPVITLVGKLSRRKGHHVLIKAAPHVLKVYPDATFLLVGGELEAPHHKQYAAELQELVQSLRVQDRVKFFGYRDEIPELLAASDLVVHCSTYADPFPGVVLQGMAMGKPVIASNIGGAREQIEDGVSGILIEPENPNSLADAVNQLLGNESKRNQISLEAWQRVHSAFGFDSYHQSYARLYEQIVDSSY